MLSYRANDQKRKRSAYSGQHMRDATRGKAITLFIWAYGFIELVIPRRRFTYTSMLSFLAEYRHLKDYAHIDFEESTYKGKKELLVDLDEIAVPLQKGCDYFWSEVKDVLAILENLLSSAKSE